MSTTQGFLADITLDGVDYTGITVTVPLTRTKSSLNKATQDGTGSMAVIPGMESGSLSLTGFIDEPLHNSLETTWAKDAAVPFVLTVVSGLATDAQWTGDVVLLSLTVQPKEDGLWEFSLDGETSGPTVYTPSVA